MRDIETIDSELGLLATLRRAARERGGPLPSIDVADALLDDRRELTGLPRLTRCLGSYYRDVATRWWHSIREALVMENRFDQFVTEIEGLDIDFVHQWSGHRDASRC